MTHHPTEDALHRLVSGDLAPSDARATERHVAACAECHALVDRLEQLQRLVAAAPRRIAPPDAVWAAVQASIRTSAPVGGPPAPRVEQPRAWTARWSRPRGARIVPGWALVAASLALVALGLGGGVLAVRARQGADAAVVAARGRGESVRAPAAGPATGEAARSARVPGAGSVEARLAAELARELGERRHVLPAQAVAAVMESLRTLNAAVAETERRLAADPNNGHLEAMLTRARLQRVEFVRSTVALTADL